MHSQDQIMESAQRLYDLVGSSTGFPEQLGGLLNNREWVEQLKLLPEDALEGLIAHLDGILDNIDRTGPQSRKCLHVLREICFSRTVLPSTYEVSGELSCCTTGQPVACGGFSDIHKGTLNGEDVCIKLLREPTKGNKAAVGQALCKEAVVWKRLDHPNVAPFRGVTFDPPQIVSKWMPGGDLREYIKANPQANLISLLLGVAKGIGYLHSYNIIHGGIKGANILIDVNGNPRIVDFGHAVIPRDSDSFVGVIDEPSSTLRYTAPEVWENGRESCKKSDVFSFGMVVIEVFTCDMPFPKSIDFVALTKIIQGERPTRPDRPDFTEDLWTLTQECWKQDPQDRPPIDRVIERLEAIESPSQVPQTTQSGAWVVAVAVPVDERLNEGGGHEAGKKIYDTSPNGGESSNHSQNGLGLASQEGQSTTRDPLRGENQDEEILPCPPVQSPAIVKTHTESPGPPRNQPATAPTETRGPQPERPPSPRGDSVSPKLPVQPLVNPPENVQQPVPPDNHNKGQSPPLGQNQGSGGAANHGHPPNHDSEAPRIQRKDRPLAAFLRYCSCCCWK